MGRGQDQLARAARRCGAQTLQSVQNLLWVSGKWFMPIFVASSIPTSQLVQGDTHQSSIWK